MLLLLLLTMCLLTRIRHNEILRLRSASIFSCYSFMIVQTSQLAYHSESLIDLLNETHYKRVTRRSAICCIVFARVTTSLVVRDAYVTACGYRCSCPG